MARKARLPFFRFFPTDYRNDPNVLALTHEARGIYMDLLCAAWDAPEPGVLPGNDYILTGLAGTTPEVWQRVKVPISRCFDTQDGHWIQKRMRAEHAAQDRNVEARKKAGKAGAQALWAQRNEKHAHGNASANAKRMDDGSLVPRVLGSQEKSQKTIARSRSLTEMASFAAWYAAFPRHVERQRAARAYAKAIATGVSAAVLLSGAVAYAAERQGEEVRYTKHPASWLNAGCWADEPTNGPAEDEQEATRRRIAAKIAERRARENAS